MRGLWRNEPRAGFDRPAFASAEDLFAWGQFDAVYVASPHQFFYW